MSTTLWICSWAALTLFVVSVCVALVERADKKREFDIGWCFAFDMQKQGYSLQSLEEYVTRRENQTPFTDGVFNAIQMLRIQHNED